MLDCAKKYLPLHAIFIFTFKTKKQKTYKNEFRKHFKSPVRQQS